MCVCIVCVCVCVCVFVCVCVYVCGVCLSKGNGVYGWSQSWFLQRGCEGADD